MSTATEIRKLSPLAHDVDCAARNDVDRIDRDHYDGRMSSQDADRLYRCQVAATAHKRMREELEPWNKAAARMTFMFLSPVPEIPKELQQLIDAVQTKWGAVIRELTGDPAPETPKERAMNHATDLLTRMAEAKRAMDALPPVQSEMRLHPDDIAALRRECWEAKTTGPVSSRAGIKIIPDESAERLPRRST